MSRTVWKYEIPLESEFIVEMPKGAMVVNVDVQGDRTSNPRAVMWALLDPDAPKERRAFFLAATGGPVRHEGRHVGTAQMNDGGFVIHVFERVDFP